MYVRLLIICAICLIATPVKSAQINLGRDFDGWTVFTPSSDSRIMYVDPDGGGTGTVYTTANHPHWSTPFSETSIDAYTDYASAYANTRSGYPDWILIKRGSTLIESIGTQVRSGRGATEPSLIGAYGSTGTSPMFKTGSSVGIETSGAQSWIAVSGISFYAHTRDPDSADYTGTSGTYGILFENKTGTISQGILFEGCRFRFYSDNSIGNDQTITGMDGATIRRCVFIDTYAQGAHTQGLWSSRSKNLIVEDSVFDHNGWYDDYTGTIGVAENLSHNVYFASVHDMTFRNNIFSRPSGAGTKFTAKEDSDGVTLDANLYVNCSLGINAGNNFPDNADRFPGLSITNNVMEGVGAEDPTGSGSPWSIWVAGTVDSDIDSNLLLNKSGGASNFSAIRLYDTNKNLDIKNNVNITPPAISSNFWYQVNTAGSGPDNVSYTGNKTVSSTSATYMMYIRDSTLFSSGMTFSNNTWYSPNASTFRSDSITYSKSEWISNIESSATMTEPVFTDDTRNVATYMDSIGETASIEGFITAVRAQDRYDWDTRLDADSVTVWIRTGFDLISPPTYHSNGSMPLLQ